MCVQLCVYPWRFFFFSSNCYELLSGASLAMCMVICSSSTVCCRTGYTWCSLRACICQLTTRCVTVDLQSVLCACLLISYHQRLLQETVRLLETLCGNGLKQCIDGEGQQESIVWCKESYLQLKEKRIHLHINLYNVIT